MRKKHLQEEPLIKKKVPVQPIAPEQPVQLKRTTTSISPRRLKVKKQLEKRILESLSSIQTVIPDFVYCDLNEDSRKWKFKDLVFKLQLGEPSNSEMAERMEQYFHDYNQKRKYGPSSEQLVFQFEEEDDDDVQCEEDKTKFDGEPQIACDDWRSLGKSELINCKQEEVEHKPKIISLNSYQNGKVILRTQEQFAKPIQQKVIQRTEEQKVQEKLNGKMIKKDEENNANQVQQKQNSDDVLEFKIEI